MGLAEASLGAAGSASFPSLASSASPVTTAVSLGEMRCAFSQRMSSAARLAGERPLHQPASSALTPTKPAETAAKRPAANTFVHVRMIVRRSRAVAL
jgi:hypothetical protein